MRPPLHRYGLPFALPLSVVLGLHALADATFVVSLDWQWTGAVLAIGWGLAFAVARTQSVPFGVQWALAFGLCVLGVRLIDWDTRKPFLRDLYSVRVGMTEAEVERIMGRWMEGTGWPANPDGEGGRVVDLGTGRTDAAEAARDGLRLSASRVFRHTNEGWGNSDWGIVRFDAQGRVEDVRFSPD